MLCSQGDCVVGDHVQGQDLHSAEHHLVFGVGWGMTITLATHEQCCALRSSSPTVAAMSMSSMDSLCSIPQDEPLGVRGAVLAIQTTSTAQQLAPFP